MEVYIVICKYDGCEECGDGGSHVVAVCTTKEKAVEFKKRHELEKNFHYGHWFKVDIYKIPVDEYIAKQSSYDWEWID